MTETLSRSSLLLKLDLDQALEKYRRGLPVMPHPPFGTPECQEVIEENLHLARRKQYNGHLVQLFALSLAFDTKDVTEIPLKHSHIAARFLRNYFQDEPQAISHLNDVSMRRIMKATTQERSHIIEARPPKPAPLPSPVIKALNWDLIFDPDYRCDDSGRVSIGPGEMWHPLEEVPLLPEFPPLPEPAEWEPPSSSPPASPPYHLEDDPFALSIVLPSSLERPSKRLRLSL
jgi:hypothetical protein